MDDVIGKVKVFINGSWIGISEEPVKFYNDIKEMKHAGIINIYTSIIFDYRYKEIRICNDSGRLTRPLIKVNKNKMNITDDIIKRLRNNELEWNDLLLKMKISDSIIEYIDAEEQNYSMIAMTPKELPENITLHIVKFILVQFLEFLHHVFHFQNTINLREIHINVQWVSKQWVFMLQIMTVDLIKLHLF